MRILMMLFATMFSFSASAGGVYINALSEFRSGLHFERSNMRNYSRQITMMEREGKLGVLIKNLGDRLDTMTDTEALHIVLATNLLLDSRMELLTKASGGRRAIKIQTYYGQFQLGQGSFVKEQVYQQFERIMAHAQHPIRMNIEPFKGGKNQEAYEAARKEWSSYSRSNMDRLNLYAVENMDVRAMTLAQVIAQLNKDGVGVKGMTMEIAKNLMEVVFIEILLDEYCERLSEGERLAGREMKSCLVEGDAGKSLYDEGVEPKFLYRILADAKSLLYRADLVD